MYIIEYVIQKLKKIIVAIKMFIYIYIFIKKLKFRYYLSIDIYKKNYLYLFIKSDIYII